MTERWSLRTRLLASLVTLVAILSGISAVQNYLAYRETSGRLFDDSLRESADLLLKLAEHELSEHGQVLGIALMNAETSAGQYGFKFQIWTPDMQAGYRSAGLPAAPLLPFTATGIGWTSLNAERWRAYAAWNDAHTLQIQIAQPLSQRAALDRHALFRLGLDVAILLGVAGLLIWWIVTASVRPLQRIADSVALRNERDLREVDAGGAPLEVQPLLAALNRLLRRVGETLQVERRFTADAAHELRTPLAAIRANAQVLVTARDAEERDRTAGDLIASVDRSTRLVEQLLSLARADQTAGTHVLQPLNLADLAREQVVAQRVFAADRQVELTTDLQPAATVGDSPLLAALLRNLIDNALRYTPAGGAVRVSTRVEGDVAVLAVEDTGPGIAPDERQKVFERFYRVAGPWTSGSGLGLSIVQRIAELHAATVTVLAGSDGCGTCMRVAIPLRPA